MSPSATSLSTRHPSTMTPPSSQQEQPANLSLTKLPFELQVNILTYLRAYDLSTVQQTCRFYNNRELVHAIVVHTAEHVYPPDITEGFDQQPLAYAPTSGTSSNSPSSGSKTSKSPRYYTFENLRNMELLVVARVLSRPEPTQGFFVSKSWCKTALLWLELQQERQRNQANSNKKKISKKKQRLRERKLSDASPPWPNVNSDLLCEHNGLQCCSNSKSARARRRLFDRKAWKVLKKLYPDSVQLDSGAGECLQCILETETARKTEKDRLEQAKLERKKPLADPVLRRFYTRTRGVPDHRLLEPKIDGLILEDKKPSALKSGCMLQPGLYYLLPRAWCHGWRHYIKTGEGQAPGPPDAASLLCDAHRLALLPPHLEAFLYGETSQLFVGGAAFFGRDEATESPMGASVAPSVASVARVPGQAPDQDSLDAMRAAGLTQVQVGQQLSAMRHLERRRSSSSLAPQANNSSTYTNKLINDEWLDRENHSVVEILTEEEFSALEKCWPGTTVFSVCFGVDECGDVSFGTPLCRECDASGRASEWAHLKNCTPRIRKSLERRVSAHLEY